MAIILSLTSPKDIAWLACVSRFYHDISKADSVTKDVAPFLC